MNHLPFTRWFARATELIVIKIAQDNELWGCRTIAGEPWPLDGMELVQRWRDGATIVPWVQITLTGGVRKTLESNNGVTPRPHD